MIKNNSNNKSLLNSYELKQFKKKSFISNQKRINYFNMIKEEGLIKHYLSFHQFKHMGLYDALKNHRSHYPANFVKGSKGYVLFKVNSDYSTRPMDWKDKRAIKETLKANDNKALISYRNDIKKEQLRLLSKIQTQFKKGNHASLKMVNNSQYSNNELNKYVFKSVIKKLSEVTATTNKKGVTIFKHVLNDNNKSVLSMLRGYKYHLNESYKAFYESLLLKNHVHLIQD